MKTIAWTTSGKEIPGYGITEENKPQKLPGDMADSLIEQGLARELGSKPKKKISRRDQLVHDCVEKEIDPPDDATIPELEKLLEDKK